MIAALAAVVSLTCLVFCVALAGDGDSPTDPKPTATPTAPTESPSPPTTEPPVDPDPSTTPCNLFDPECENGSEA
ncbi:hypothetical protein [Streptomyces longispororuber]|uniref:hypothetical protein n=1 Tax=Streptomyces longispororuber TaxID=68230 RepID=UPI0036FCEBBF